MAAIEPATASEDQPPPETLAERLARMYLVLTRTNRAISRAHTQRDLLASLCSTIVTVGRMRMSWVGVIDRESGRVVPAASAGFVDGYLDTVDIQLHGPHSNGPTGQAIRLRTTIACDDIANDPRMEPWRPNALARGFLSSIGLPLYVGSELFGVLTAYSDQAHRFDASEIELLEELARDVSFGLTKLAESAERQKAQAALTASEARFQTTAEVLLDAFVIIRAVRNPAGHIVDFIYEFANEAAYLANHLTRSDDLVGRSLLAFLPEHEGTGLLHLYSNAVETGEPIILDDVDYEDMYDGERLHRVFDIRGRKIGDSLAITWRDVTERRHAERQRADELANKVRERTVELQAASERAAELARASTSMLAAETREEVATALFEAVSRLSDAADGVIVLVSPNSDDLDVVASFGLEADSVARIRSSPGTVRTPIRDAVRSNRAIVIDDSEAFVRRYPEVARRATEMRDRARVAFPMRVGDRRVGGVSLGFDSRPFSENEISFFLAIANAAALALERLRLEQAERQTRGMLDVVVAQMPVGVTILDGDGRLLYRNAAYEAIAGGGAAPWRPLWGDGTVVAVHELPAMRSLATGEVVVNDEMLIERPDGTRGAILETAAPIVNASGEISAAVVVTLDITDRKAAEQLRDAFVGVLSHELRTPVTTIYAAAQYLLGKGERLEPELRTELAGDIVAESERLSRMVDDLLVLARAERGVDMTVSGAALVQHRLAAVVLSVATAWPDRTFSCRMPDDLAPVTGDEDYLEHVFRNLIGNAAKYGRTKVSVVVASQEETISIAIADDGPGIPAAERQRVFELFARLNSTSRLPGAGIGLFVVQRLLEAMGGSVSVTDRPEGGAEFTVVLPRYSDELEAF